MPVERLPALALALALAACAPAAAPEAAAPPDTGKADVLELLATLAEAPPMDAALLERALRVRMAPRGSGATGARPIAHGTLSVSLFNGSATLNVPGKLPDTPCMLSIGELLDRAEELGYTVAFHDLGTKPAWSLTRAGVGGRRVGLSVMTNPLSQPPERRACMAYLSASTEAPDGQAVP